MVAAVPVRQGISGDKQASKQSKEVKKSREGSQKTAANVINDAAFKISGSGGLMFIRKKQRKRFYQSSREKEGAREGCDLEVGDEQVEQYTDKESKFRNPQTKKIRQLRVRLKVKKSTTARDITASKTKISSSLLTQAIWPISLLPFPQLPLSLASFTFFAG